MLRSGILRDVVLFILVLLFLWIVIPLISQIFKQLIILQVIILIAGTIVLTYIVQKARGRSKKQR